MRQLSTPLRNLLANGRSAWMVELYDIQLVTGTRLRWTNADTAVTWGGNTYSVGPGLERSRLTWRIGLDGNEDADQMRVTVIPRPTDTVGGVLLQQALHQGDFDGATVSLSRAYGSTPGTVVDVAPNLFVGKVGSVEVEDYAYVVTVLAPTAELDQPFPRNVVQAQCGNRLFDETCGLDAASYRVLGQVTGSINAARSQFATNLVQASGWFTLGRFKWRSGANTGRWQYVRAHAADGTLTFPAPWPNTVAVADNFEVYAGCDKVAYTINPATGQRTPSTCIVKFNNLAHFRGMPFVPSAETTT